MILLGVSVSCATPMPWFGANGFRVKASAPFAREESPVYAEVEQPAIIDEPFYNFMKISLTEAPLVTTPTSPSIVQVYPADVLQYPAESAQTVEVEDPLYHFLKNILPQVPARVPESQVPSIAASDAVDPASHPPTDALPQRYAPSDESFLDIGHPPKPRLIGFPQITNTRENVVQQNNWAIL